MEGQPMFSPDGFGSNPKWARQYSTDSMDPVSASLEVPGYGQVQHDKAEFILDSSLTHLKPSADEGHHAILAASEDMQIMIKTIANEDWIDLIRRLQGKRTRTSTTLPPPGGRGMKFFGNKMKETTSCLGLMWDRRELDLSEAYIWPSGYFAKTEFNVSADGSMRNGRREALVTLEQVLQTNTDHIGAESVLSFNEFLTFVHGVVGVCGLFVRTTCVKHLLWAMGIRSLVTRTLPGIGELPLFVHDVDRGFFPFSRAAQRRVVEDFLMHRQEVKLDKGEMPLMPVDTHHLQLGEQQQLEFHGAYGITSEALTTVIDSMMASDGCQAEDDSPEEMLPMSTEAAQDILLCGLRGAVDNNNTPSALSLVRKVSPFLFQSGIQHPRGPMQESTGTILRAITRGNEEFASCLHNLEARASSKSMLVTVGATIALNDFATGRMLPRIENACRELEGWLQHSNSVIFRLQSWNELKAKQVGPNDEGPSIGSFVTRKAVENRTNFLQALQEVEHWEKARNLVDGMAKLQSLVAQLRHPCLRLKMLQHILDLDDRYNIQAIVSVANLAYKVISLEAQRPAGKSHSKVGSSDKKPVLPQKQGAAPLFELETAACLMQGVDVSDASDA